MKRIITALLSILLFFSFSKAVYAVTDPVSVPNNKVGIHIFSEKDLEDAAKLVDSSGGDWGYVTFVIAEGERDHDRWQKVFDQMRRLHLIPIVRLATKAQGDTWEIPKEEEINNWIAFLNSLNWVIQNRYVVIGNEPNHANEWGGKLDPVAYANYLKNFSEKLKAASSDFFILPAAMDASAKNQKDTMEESKYLRLMVNSIPDIFDKIDGWNSHSYPNPDFSGKETDSGKGTIRTYDWELSFLHALGNQKSFPVFITETGWSSQNLSEDEISAKLSFAFQNVWDDNRVVAVTPFILDYSTAPFDYFSWEKKDGSFYKFYSVVQSLKKITGQPQQIESGQILAAFAQPVIPYGSNFLGAILARNTGQSIWKFGTNSVRSEDGASLNNYSFSDIEPTKLGLVIFKSASPQSTGIYSQSLFLTGSKNQKITNSFSIEAYVVRIDWTKIARFFIKSGKI